MDTITHQLLEYFALLSVEQTIGLVAAIFAFAFAFVCYVAITQYRYLQNKKYNSARLKRLAGIPLSNREIKQLTNHNKHPGCRPVLGKTAQRIEAFKMRVKSKWHKMVVSVGTDYNPWALRDKVTQLQKEVRHESTEKWESRRQVEKLQDDISRMVLGEIETEETEVETEKFETIPTTNFYEGPKGITSEFA